MIDIIIDQKKYEVAEGRNLLAVCLENGIYIPNLCFLDDEESPEASCRMCFVEIEGTPSPVPACTICTTSGLKARTDTPAVRRLQRSALRLLLSTHDVDCKHCHANRACELQKIARFLQVGLKSKPLAQIERSVQVDTGHPWIDHYPHRCVLCGKCIRTCSSRHELPVFSFVGRGIDTVVRHYRISGVKALDCPACHRCVDICPVGALKLRVAG
ncbi:MAG: 2Fe-2S iron-sulfur cluster-binding protein [Desulfobacteraceae bacterium]